MLFIIAQYTSDKNCSVEVLPVLNNVFWIVLYFILCLAALYHMIECK